MVPETFVALFGLATTLTVHIYFYISAYTSDSGFTGLLKKEENILMDSMISIGALQVVYFVWHYTKAVFDASSPNVATGVNLIALAMLGIFSYPSSRLIRNMQDIQEQYGFEVDME